jgi:histidinol-phosphate/aromatic aminotransferase/cobyric acid decarboxylase-like protein
MKTSKQSNYTMKLNSYYEELAFDLNDGDSGNFLSGWQCENPYASDLLTRVKERSNHIDYRKYRYFDEDEKLPEKILSIHTSFDGVCPQKVLCATGSTSLLYAFVTYLKRRGVKTIYYVPPIYFTLHIAFELYQIQTISISEKQPFEKDFSLKLPEEDSCVLFLTDPIWYTGTKYSDETMREIAEWQKRNSSLVFVDGSLQYLHWNGVIGENTAMLDPAYTFRLVCPSKQLAIHGYRFSYILLPASHERGMAWTYANVAGPAPADSIIFAYEAMTAILDRNLPDKLMQAVFKRHRYLRIHNVIESEITPECGYFVFEKTKVSLPDGYSVMDGKYFGLRDYPGYIKINLLSPSINKLFNANLDSDNITNRL